MKPLEWLRKPAKSGIEGAISDGIKLGLVAIGGAIFNFVLARIGGLSAGFWSARSLANYQVAVWVFVALVAAVWITYSAMRRRMARIEAEARRREQEAKELSELDPATGLLNLRALNDQLPQAMEAAKGAKEPLMMIIFDIDGFKEVNSLIGHDRANVILKGVATSLSPRAPDLAFRYPENVQRRTRVAFRYGGDEFIIVAGNTSIIGGTDPATGKRVFDGSTMAERLQTNVWNKDFPDLARKRRERDRPSKLTVSAGIADTNPTLDPNDTIEALTHRAELALMEAKRQNGEIDQKDDSFRGTIVPYSVDLETREAS